VNARERWQALQSRLTAARTFLENGDRDRALAEIDAALAIDPSFLAAAALRERILGREVQGTGFRVPNPANPRNPEPATRNPPPDAYTRFEQKARRRRVDRKVDAAQQAIARRNLRAAASALDEVIELDPNLPELSDLTAAFDDLRRSTSGTHRGPVVAAAAVFGALVFGASWIHEGSVLLSHPFATIASLVETPKPEPIATTTPGVDTPLEAEPTAVATSSRPNDVGLMPADMRSPLAPAAPTPTPTPAVSPSAAVIDPAALTPSPLPAPAAPAAVDVPRVPVVPPSRTDGDETQIARALQQYRTAYDLLDAEQAKAVWPAVNEAALARAFASLDSQTLTFDDCRTQVRGDTATATCQGTARYVPKIGSREPHVEPRTWTFALKRSADSWEIESARVQQ